MSKKSEQIRRFERNITEIYFGEKPRTETLWDGCWNPAYRYKKQLEKLPYYPVLKITGEKDKIKDIKIVFHPNHWKYKETGEYKYLITEDYNWVNPYFWIDNGFYPKTKFARIDDEFFNADPKKFDEYGHMHRHPFEEDFEIIFDDIWKICVSEEGGTLISRYDFNHYIWLIRNLIENTLVFSIRDIDKISWEKYVYGYLEEAEALLGEQISRRCLKGWRIYFKKKYSVKEMNEAFIDDIKYLLNIFFEKVKADNGLGIFLYKIYDSYVNELVKRGIFIKCLNCGRIADYHRTKKFCSKNKDGQNCLKRYYSRLDYQKFKKKRLKAKRNWIRKTRKEIPGY